MRPRLIAVDDDPIASAGGSDSAASMRPRLIAVDDLTTSEGRKAYVSLMLQ